MVFIVCEKTYYNLRTTRWLLVFFFLTYFLILFLLTYHIFYISEITTMLIFITLYLLNNNFKSEMNKKEFRIKMVHKLREEHSVLLGCDEMYVVCAPFVCWKSLGNKKIFMTRNQGVWSVYIHMTQI